MPRPELVSAKARPATIAGVVVGLWARVVIFVVAASSVLFSPFRSTCTP